jgi:glucokinase
MSPRLAPDEPGSGPGPGSRVVLAVDVGGTKLAAGLVDDAGQVRVRAQVATPPAAPGGGEEVYAALADLVDRVRAEGLDLGISEPVVCGVGSGGPMTAGGEELSPLNIAGWRGFPLRARLAERVGLEVFVDNDAKALALAEGWLGAAEGVDDYLAMVVSTGIGGGVVLDGDLLDGAAGNAGHIGHINVEPAGRLCRCGSTGCLEAEASGTAIAEITGAPPAQAGPEVVDRVGTLVGRAVADVAILLDLQLAVVAGSVALGYGDRFFAAAQAEIDRRARLDFAQGCRIIPAGLGASGPLVGAAAVGLRGQGWSLRAGQATATGPQ